MVGPFFVHKHSFHTAWNMMLRKAFDPAWVDEARQQEAQTHPFGMYDWHDPAKLKEMESHYGYAPGASVWNWLKPGGPGETKMAAEVDRLRGRLGKFGTEIKPIADWNSIMEMEGTPSSQWNEMAHQTIGSLSDTSKVGVASGTPTFACNIGGGKKCPKCYAQSLESKNNVMIPLMQHLKMLGENPARHASAMQSLLGQQGGTYRGNWSGDYQNVSHIAQALSIAAGTPNVQHWLHTREAPALREYLSQYEQGSDEWLNAIPENTRMRLSMPYNRMTSGPEGGGIRGDEEAVTSSAWRQLLGEDEGHMQHPRVVPTEVGTEPRDDAFMCPTGLKVKDPETGEKLGACTDFGCSECGSGSQTVIYPGHWAGSTNIKMPDKHGVQERGMTPEQLAHEQAKAIAMRVAHTSALNSQSGEFSGEYLDPTLDPRYYD